MGVFGRTFRREKNMIKIHVTDIKNNNKLEKKS